MTRRPRIGLTMVELLISMGLGVMATAGAWQLLLGGLRMFESGIARARGPEAAVLLLNQLEQDLVQTLQAPGDPRPPVRIRDGRRLTFYRPLETVHLACSAAILGRPASWNLSAPNRSGTRQPVRDGRVLGDVEVLDWNFDLLPPSLEEERPGWCVAVRVRFPTGARNDPGYEVNRLIRLPQPSSQFLHFPGRGAELVPGLVVMLPRPADPGFEGLGPPDDAGPEYYLGLDVKKLLDELERYRRSQQTKEGEWWR